MFLEAGYGEVLASPIHTRYGDPISCLQFDPQYELLWAGFSSGFVATIQCPSLERYASWRVDQHPVEDHGVLDLVLLGGCGLALTHHVLRMRTYAGLPRLTVKNNNESGPWLSMALEPGQSETRVVVGSKAGAVEVFDLLQGRSLMKASVIGEGGGPVRTMRAGVGRGLIAVGTDTGLLLLDPRTRMKVEQSVTTHAAGLLGMDGRGDLVATCGYTWRRGMHVRENLVKVFDVRGGLRQVHSVQFPDPELLRFHPNFSNTLLISSLGGCFAISDIHSMPLAQRYQVDTAGDHLTCCALSPSGKCIAFGGSGGYVHFWSSHPDMKVNLFSQDLAPHPPLTPPPPSVPLTQSSPFSLVPQFFSVLGKQLSGYDSHSEMEVGLPPRVVSDALLKEARKVDFVLHVPNTKFVRGRPYGEATRAVGPLRNQRVTLLYEKADVEALKAQRAHTRAAAGGAMLPARYKRVLITQAGMKWEEFDFSFYNRTRFAGLENNLPNWYFNALIQLLYFIPFFRQLILSHEPEPQVEFCLTCELMFLFRMMVSTSGHGTPCQASNLLRTIRQIPEVSALGLLEGAPRKDPATEGAFAPGLLNACQLPRRLNALSRFLLENLVKEAASAALRLQTSQGAGTTSTQTSPATMQRVARSGSQYNASSVPANLLLHPPPPPPPPPPPRVPSSPPQSPSPTTNICSSPEPIQDSRVDCALDKLFGLVYRQRMQRLGAKAERCRESRTYQIDLLGPDKPPQGKSSTSPSTTGVRSPSLRVATSPASPSNPPVPSFGSLLEKSLTASTETCAWFDEGAGYQPVKQSRVPLRLPQVLAINCSILNSEEFARWQQGPRKSDSGGMRGKDKGSHWLPWAFKVEAWPEEWEVRVTEAETTEELETPKGANPGSLQGGPRGPAPVSGVFVLTGMICQIRDADEEEDASTQQCEGHSVALVKVQRPYQDHEPLFPTPPPMSPMILASTSPFNTPRAYSCPEVPAAVEPPVVEEPDLPESLDDVFANLAVASSGSGSRLEQNESQAGSGQGPEGPALLSPTIQRSFSQPEGHHRSQSVPWNFHAGGTWSDDNEMVRTPMSHPISLPSNLSRTTSLGVNNNWHNPWGEYAGQMNGKVHVGPPQMGGWELRRAAEAPRSELGAQGAPGARLTTIQVPAAPPGGAPSRQSSGAAAEGRSSSRGILGDVGASSLQLMSPPPGDVSIMPRAPDSRRVSSSQGLTPLLSGGSSLSLSNVIPPRLDWVVFNDFCVTPISASEVMQTFDGQKLPTLMTYTQVSELIAAEDLKPPELKPLLGFKEFDQLCQAPPLQGADVPIPRTFLPLDAKAGEMPRRGMKFAIDAEFVALTPPETTFEYGMEVQVKPSRLSLARVSVLRGEGPRAGTCCIDDHVRAVENVYDYLTRFSGVMPGDLEPSTSKHYLTTLKQAYLKLSYLIDTGCVFIGHGLKQDFRMLNLTVPSDQVIDTVELFRFKHQRRLSLRFLASYLLGVNIQGSTHDSIEDARTALKLYQLYEELVETDTFHSKLAELYRWGKQYGWEPVVLVNGVPQAPLMQPPNQ